MCRFQQYETSLLEANTKLRELALQSVDGIDTEKFELSALLQDLKAAITDDCATQYPCCMHKNCLEDIRRLRHADFAEIS